MKELNELRHGLMHSSLMLLKDYKSHLECSFIKEGLVNHIVTVEDDVLAEALRQRVQKGIAEGIVFNTLKHEFDSFALHVKARKLYLQLSFNLPMYLAPAAKDEVYSEAIEAAVA